MRLWILLLAVLLLAPAPAGAQSASEAEPPPPGAAVEEEEDERRPPRSCATLRKQIAHFEDVAERARERDNELWERSTEGHIRRLQARAERECPDDGGNPVLEAIGRFAKAAARTAVKYFTAGQL